MAKRRNERSQPAARIEPVVSDPLETDSGALQPFIKIFRYDPENATRESLGTLLGIFEIGVQSESTAYIVNFIASVAKKEYFSQPRRSPSDSLEATLHKINRALAELVKHGNTEWLGSLRGVVCVLEGSAIHFSVTGEGCILLIRNGIISEISEGLSSDEAAVHPLKTFTDTASGRLQLDDTFIITTPALFDILSLQEIEKASHRLPGERFIQFLRTAIVNQLPFGGAFVVTTREVIAPPKKKTRPAAHRADSAETLPNVFSQQVFSAARHAKTDTGSRPSARTASEHFSEQAPTDYVDSQTGHIYVQGEAAQNIQPTSERRERFRLMTEEWTFRLRQFGRSGQYRVRSVAFDILNESRLLFARGTSLAGSSIRKIRISRQANVVFLPENGTEAKPEPAPSPEPETVDDQTRHIPIIATPDKVETVRRTLAALGMFFSSAARRMIPPIAASIRFIARHASRITGAILVRYRSLEKKYRYAVLIGILGFAGAGVWSLASILSRPEPVAVVQETLPEPPVVTEPSLVAIDTVDTLLDRTGIIRVHSLASKTLLLTKTSVIVSENASSPETTIPSEAGNIVQSAPMPAIGILFVLTDRGKLLSFSPTNRTFAENTISLPDISHITAIASYSSYLYVLDASERRIIRYPRTEGGFGPGVEWLKADAAPAVSDARTFAVNERLFTASTDTINTFSKGRQDTGVRFENSATPFSFRSIALLPGHNMLAALDTDFGRVALFDLSDGHLVKQYAANALRQATGFALDEDRSIAIFNTASGAFSFQVLQ